MTTHYKENDKLSSKCNKSNLTRFTQCFARLLRSNLILGVFASATRATARTLHRLVTWHPNFGCLTFVLSGGRLAQQCCMMLASFKPAFRLQQRDANTKESKAFIPILSTYRLFENVHFGLNHRELIYIDLEAP